MKKLSLLFSLLFVLLTSGCSNTAATGATPDKSIKKVKKEYYTGGMLRSEFLMYDNTEMNGLKKHYGYEGKLTSVAEIRNGVKHGMEKWFDKEGRIIQTIPYENGRIHGVVTKYYPNGDPQVTITYENGSRNGPAVKYREDGRVYDKALFKDDQRVK